MSRIKAKHVFTSESVSEGHPDKICDQISDAVLDRCLEHDSESRVACETLVTSDLVVLSGEITCSAKINWEEIVRNVIREIGYTDTDVGFSADTCKVFVCLHPQSEDISQGVTEGRGTFVEQGAGDQGMMFGYATNETEQLMPAPILYAHRIVGRLAELRHNDPKTYWYLRPDAKSQVSVLYDDGRPVALTTVVVSHQHHPEVDEPTLRTLVDDVVHDVVPADLLSLDIDYYVNPTGRFVLGGPHADTGLTGRKIIVDTYGGVGCHGGGAFSGKDPSKVDRSAAYMCRYVAKNIVASGLAEKCEVEVAYAIGVSRPLSVNIDTFGTGKLADTQLQAIVMNEDIFDLHPATIISRLGLKYPANEGWCYRDTAAYGHFGRSGFPWEKTDKSKLLQQAAES